MATTAPHLILDPESSRKLRAEYAPRYGERPKIVTLGRLPGLPMGRYYVHPDGSLTRPRDEMDASIENIRAVVNRMVGAFGTVSAATRAALSQDQSDFTKGA